MGGFVRSTWDEATEITAASLLYTAKTYGPDRNAGFSVIPANVQCCPMHQVLVSLT